MNLSRVALAAVVAWIVDAAYGFVVYGMVLKSEFGRYPAIYRPMETQGTYMPILFAGILLAMFAAAYIYAKGYEGGSGFQEGMRFGVLLGLFVVGYVSVANYSMISLGRRLAGCMAIAGLVEWILAGIVIGIVYKPISQSKTMRA